MERVKGIEPSSSAWKAVALPLSYTRAAHVVRKLARLRGATARQPSRDAGRLAEPKRP
jgi:hypothetical protein